MAFTDTIKLISGGGLISGNIPPKIKLKQVARKVHEQGKTKQELLSFGLFDTNTSNYNTYYPNVTSKDLNPSEKDFINPVFRALSEVVVHKEWNPVDFSRNKVLRRSMPLLLGQTTNVDHEDAVGNAIGAVSEVYWEQSYKTKGGLIVPAGINSRLKIDGKSHPKVARAILMKPPAIHSTSVTVQFLWEKSHPEMADDEFWKNLGAYDKYSKLISRVVTKVRKYNEISLVSHGADPFAQLIKEDGEINNPHYASISYNSATPKQKKKSKLFLFDLKQDIIENSAKTTIPKELIINQSSQSKKGMATKIKKKQKLSLSAIMKQSFGIPNFDPANTVHLKKFARKVKDLKSTTGDNAKLEASEEQVEKLTARINKMKKAAKLRLTTLRKKVLKNYSLSVAGKKDADVVATLKEADEKMLILLNKDYEAKLEAKYPSCCADCGSNNITKSSARLQDAEDDEEEKTVSPEKLAEQYEYQEIGAGTSFLHGEDDEKTSKKKKEED